ncbi:hypothetical protein BLOT_012393 [Blomia tropicalis]|nr:hypothetical protein BLOT_012393 [Blomia tropicalis]
MIVKDERKKKIGQTIIRIELDSNFGGGRFKLEERGKGETKPTINGEILFPNRNIEQEYEYEQEKKQ